MIVASTELIVGISPFGSPRRTGNPYSSFVTITPASARVPPDPETIARAGASSMIIRSYTLVRRASISVATFGYRWIVVSGFAWMGVISASTHDSLVVWLWTPIVWFTISVAVQTLPGHVKLKPARITTAWFAL